MARNGFPNEEQGRNEQLPRPSEMSASEEKKNCERKRFDLVEPTLEALGRSTDYIGGSFSIAECQILGHHQGEAGCVAGGCCAH